MRFLNDRGMKNKENYFRFQGTNGRSEVLRKRTPPPRENLSQARTRFRQTCKLLQQRIPGAKLPGKLWSSQGLLRGKIWKKLIEPCKWNLQRREKVDIGRMPRFEWLEMINTVKEYARSLYATLMCKFACSANSLTKIDVWSFYRRIDEKWICFGEGNGHLNTQEFIHTIPNSFNHNL